MTSLAQQLQKLRVAQKDEVSLPSRTKISFLFDIKKAANIEDQTLYYLCQKGISELDSSLKESLSFDLLDEHSLQFYRGTQTKDQLKAIDDKLDTMLRFLSPYLMNPSTHKILEYMIRIYDIQAHLKHTFIMCFLPYFETAYFLKAIQLVNLKEDEYFSFLHEFGYKGEAIEKKVLIKALARGHGVLYAKYSQWCFKSNEVLAEQETVNLHQKFLGNMMVEILQDSKQDQDLMFNVLPSIALSMKSEYIELKHSGLMAIGQLCSQKALSKEYTRAFVRQILLMIDDAEESLKIRGLVVLMIIVQYQNLNSFEENDMKLLVKIPKKVMSKVSVDYDISLLMKAFVMSSLKSEQLFQTLSKLIKNLKLNLRCQFIILSALLNFIVENDQQDIALRFLKLFKEIDSQSYNQTILYHLKQTEDPDQKEKLKKIIQGDGPSNIFQKVGDVEYSLLSALGSARKQVRLSAINTLSSKKQLHPDEAELITLFLAQIVSRCEDDEEMMNAMLTALSHLTEETSQPDLIFNCLEKMIQSSIYSKHCIQKGVNILLHLKVVQNLKQQSIVAFFFSKKCYSEYCSFLIDSKGKESQIAENLPQSFEFLQEIMSSFKAYYDLEKIEYLMSQVISQIGDKYHLEEINALLSSIKKIKKSNNLLMTIVSGLPKASYIQTCVHLPLIHKILRKIILISLTQKQLNPSFNLARLHNCLQQEQFNSPQKYCEFHVRTAIECKNTLKRVFSIMHLGQQMVEAQFAIPVVLMLLADEDKVVRGQALKYAQEIVNNQTKETIKIFDSTDKPKSAKKTKNPLTPLKPAKAILFLEELLKSNCEILQDASQLSTFMNKSTHEDVFEIMLRTLLDWPSSEIKSKLLQLLAKVENHNMVFSITLSDNLNRLYNVKDITKELLQSVAKLINGMCLKQTGEQAKALKMSLIIPFLSLGQADEETVLILATQNLFNDFEILDSQESITIFKTYLKLQKSINSSVIRSQIKQCFLEKAVLKGENMASLMKELKEGLAKASDGKIDVQSLDIELIMETLAAVNIQKDHKLLESNLSLLRSLVMMVIISKDSQLFFSVELCCQVCIQIIDNNHSSNAQALRVLDPSKITQDLLFKSTESLWEAVKAHLDHQAMDENDPFNQFMMEVDTEEKKEEKDDDLAERISEHLQVTRSLSRLLLKSQKQIDGNIGVTQKYLLEISNFISGLQEDEDSQSLKFTEMTNRIFRFYHREVCKTVENLNNQGPVEMSHTRDVITVYIQTVKSIVEKCEPESSRIQDHKIMLLQMLKTSGMEHHAHIAILVLLALSKDTVRIKDDLKLGGPLLDLARSIIVECTHQSQNLTAIVNQILILVAMPLNANQLEFTDKKFAIIDQKLVDQAASERTWLSSKPFISNLRRLKFLALYSLESWLTSDNEVRNVLATIAGEEPSPEIQEQFLNCYLLLGIMKDGLNNYLSQKDYKSEKEPAKSKSSIKRLCNRVDSLLSALNQMVSHEIHCTMVHSIMTLKNKDILNLKTNALQLLLDKTADFNFSFSQAKQASMVKIFEPLIDEAIRCLKKDMKEVAKSTEKQTYAATLFALISKTACKEYQSDDTLSLSLSFLSSQKDYPLTLNTQLLLTQTQLFEVYQSDILEHLPLHISHLLTSFSLSKQGLYFSESFTKALLKGTQSAITMFSKFLNTQQIEDLIKNLLTVENQFEEELSAILETLSKEGPKAMGLKQLFQAVFNAFEVLETEEKNLSNVAIRYFSKLLKPVVMRMKKDFCADNFKKICQFFKEALGFPQKFYKSNNNVDIHQIDRIESCIVGSFQQFVIKLNEDQLGPVILMLVKWAQKHSEVNMHRQIILYRVLSGIVEALGEFAIPFIKLQIQNTCDVLQALINDFKSMNSAGKKRPRVSNEMLEAADGQGHTMRKLLVVMCENLTLNFKNDTGAFIQGDIFELLAEPLVVEMLTLVSMGKYYNEFIDKTVKVLAYEMIERINNDSLWIRFNNAILMKTREEHPWAVRHAALKVVEHVFSNLGERYLVVLNDTLGFLSESLEDENPEVEQVAKSIVKRVETLTGESIQDYLK